LPDEQPEQELPPTAEVTPLLSDEKQANFESTLFASWLHFGHSADSSALLMERSISNFE
jgi:hypothetical protein